MGLKAAVQALKKAEELKAKVTHHNDLLNNSEVWNDQQQLQTVYHNVLVLDLEYALDKKVEQELWQLGFKHHIDALQHLSRDKKNPRRSECQALLSWCLEAASGFYLTLLEELCSVFELDLPFRRRGAIYGQSNHEYPDSDPPQQSSCLYICQYCLVHLGDIARYRSQRKQAEMFYRRAILLSPSSGQPYNQLALLETIRGDRLSTVFHYVRSLSVKHPFPAAASNLARSLLNKNDNEDPLIEMHSKLSLNEFLKIFLRVHGLLHLAADLDQAELCVRTLNATFTALVATQAFSTIKLIQMTAINLYALRHTIESFSKNQLTADELRVKNLILELLAGAFSAYLLPIYTMSNDSKLLEYHALPAIKLTLDWIKTDPKVLSESIFTKRLQIWPSLCKLLNALQTNSGEFENKNYDKIPLPEDRELQCFLPLVNAFKELDFITDNLNTDASYFNKLRITRLVNLGLWLSNQVIDNNIVIITKRLKKPNRIVFEPSNKQPDPTTELLKELKYFNIKESNGLVKEINGILKEPNGLVKELKNPSIKALEKRGGILKPQGSLEKAREEREQQQQQAMLFSSSENGDSRSNTSASNSSASSTRTNEPVKVKRVRKNVALQALAKKFEENKQVTFQTESSILKPKEKLAQNELSTLYQIPTVVNHIPERVLPQTIPMPPKPTDPPPPAPPLNFPPNFPQNYPRLPMNVSNVPFSVPYNTYNPPINYPKQSFNPQSAGPANQNNGFNLPPPSFDVSNPAINFLPPKDPFTNPTWMRDDKLPMPPSAWWNNNQNTQQQQHQQQQTTTPRQFPPAQTADLYNPSYSFNMNGMNSTSFVQETNRKPENLDLNRSYNGTIGSNGAYNNVSVWNSGPDLKNNLQMLLNQQPGQQQMMQGNQLQQQQYQRAGFGDVKQIGGPSEGLAPVDSIDKQSTNTMPGYSLFNSNWAPNLTFQSTLKSNQPDCSAMRQQSLFCGPGPSPLERLLEQQKQLRGSKEDT